MSRTESEELQLAGMEEKKIKPPPFLAPVMSVWESWED
jgi:hypothetical protein